MSLRIRHAFALVACACACAAAASGETYEIRDFGRPLSPEEKEAYRKPVVKIMEIVAANLAKRGWDCSGRVLGPTGTIVTEEGILPERLEPFFGCIRRNPFVQLPIVIDFEFVARERAIMLADGEILLRRGAATLRMLRPPTTPPRYALVLESVAGAGTPGAAMSVEFGNDDESRELALALDHKRLLAEFRKIVPLKVGGLPLGPEPPNGVPSSARDSLEREVIGSFLTRTYVVAEYEPPSLVFPEKVRRVTLQGAPDIRASLFADFASALGSQTGPALPEKAKVIPHAEFKKLFAQDEAAGFAELKRRYPDSVGFFRISRVGFSADARQAMVYVEWMEPPGVGYGYVVVLSRAKTGWTVLYNSSVWM